MHAGHNSLPSAELLLSLAGSATVVGESWVEVVEDEPDSTLGRQVNESSAIQFEHSRGRADFRRGPPPSIESVTATPPLLLLVLSPRAKDWAFIAASVVPAEID